MTYAIPFTQLGKNNIPSAGGKGANLGEMTAAGFPVPPGFVLITDAYDAFVREHGLQQQIVDLAVKVSTDDLQSGEDASEAIKSLFLEAELPEAIRVDLVSAYVDLTAAEENAVAVRSSGTAEDLPDASFAGQQETVLNVQGITALVDAVKHCWASLWTARAIIYRLKQGIAPTDVSLAVVVQKMVPADVSGILFTANPTTGNRSEIMINAGYGLGEAIVGGHITPDTYVIDRHNGDVKESIIGSKESVIVSAEGQGTMTQAVLDVERQSVALSPDMIQALITVSKRIEQHFNAPQDIEWAYVNDNYWILQSRPITNLPPALLTEVTWEPPSPGGKLIRRQVVENMPDPLSPLFDDLYLSEGLDKSMDTFLDDFALGQKIDIGLFTDRPFFVTVNGYAYSRANFRFSLKLILQIIPVYIKMMLQLLRNAIPRWQNDKLPAYLVVIDRWKAVDKTTAADKQLWSGIRALTVADAAYWFEVSIILGLAKVTDGLLHRFLTKLGEERGLTSGLFLRGFPSKTLEAQGDLETIADQLRASADVQQLVIGTAASHLLEALSQLPEAEDVVEGIQAYFKKYGHQIYTLDFVEPTQGEDSLPIFVGLKALVQNPIDSVARQAELAQERDTLAETTAQSLGPFKRWLFRLLLGWAEKYGPYREEALFYIGAAWPTLRGFAYELGQRLVEGGMLKAPEDIYYLRMAEVESAVAARATGQTLPDLKQLTQARRALREARKQLQPPGKIPDVPFKFGPINMSIFETQKQDEAEGDNLKGFAVSPGKITAPATVILSPADFEKMRPGTILVCPTTTPAWTPLFSQAKGLVTEIGGILAHGSIVAREYGIPAVMGLGHATQRIADGQMISVDGNSGVVRILDPSSTIDIHVERARRLENGNIY